MTTHERFIIGMDEVHQSSLWNSPVDGISIGKSAQIQPRSRSFNPWRLFWMLSPSWNPIHQCEKDNYSDNLKLWPYHIQEPLSQLTVISMLTYEQPVFTIAFRPSSPARHARAAEPKQLVNWDSWSSKNTQRVRRHWASKRMWTAGFSGHVKMKHPSTHQAIIAVSTVESVFIASTLC